MHESSTNFSGYHTENALANDSLLTFFDWRTKATELTRPRAELEIDRFDGTLSTAKFTQSLATNCELTKSN